MARKYERYKAAFECQASTAITADALSAGTVVEFDTTAGSNADGCDEAEIEIDVTVAPATAARCEIYMQALEHDLLGNSANKLVGSAAIETTADKYLVKINGLSEKGNIVLKAIDYGFTASASFKGQYPADA